MSKFKNLNLQDEVVKGKYGFHGEDINVEFDLEEEEEEVQIDDFSELISSSENWIEGFSTEILERLIIELSKELTDSAYGDSDYKPTDKDYKDLEKELTLTEIRFFSDEVVSLVFEAKKEYPDMNIFCQINKDFHIEDLMVE